MVMSEAVEYYVVAGTWWVGIFLAMPDHWHALVAFPDPGEMSKVVRDWKRFVAKRTRIVWQDGFFDRRMRTRSDLAEKWEYITWNPVKAGLVRRAEDWPYVWMSDDGNGAFGATRPTAPEWKERIRRTKDNPPYRVDMEGDRRKHMRRVRDNAPYRCQAFQICPGLVLIPDIAFRVSMMQGDHSASSW